uniref:hypothetical protein n=1 Tax=Microbulbifer agarilyticus TaxID=260552 RepID=UPI0002559179|nr:hypothetical protein [Microbulbifer agarilyticus]
MLKQLRIDDYKCIHPNKIARIIVKLPPKTAKILSELQHQEQKKRDRKVAVAELVDDIINRRVELPPKRS